MRCYRRNVWKRTMKRLHTIAIQINICNYWPNCGVTLFQTPMLKFGYLIGKLHSGVIISTVVWYVEINGMGCKMSSFIELKYMAFHYVTTCLKCIITRRTEHSFLSKQSVMSVRKTLGLLSLYRLSELVWDSKIQSRGPERQQLWGRRRFWGGDRGIVTATGPTNIQRSRVQQFVSFKCLWRRGNFSEWARWTGPNSIRVAMDMAFWPSRKCSTRL
jgi:hypothetical protein